MASCCSTFEIHRADCKRFTWISSRRGKAAVRVPGISLGSITPVVMSAQGETKHPDSSAALLPALPCTFCLSRTPQAISVLLWRRAKEGNADSWPPSNLLQSRPLLPPALLLVSAKPFGHPHYLISEGSLTSILNRDPRQFLPSDNSLPNLVYSSPAFPFSLSKLCCTASQLSASQAGVKSSLCSASSHNQPQTRSETSRKAASRKRITRKIKRFLKKKKGAKLKF